MAVTDDVREAIASLKKITDTQDKIWAVQRDISLMLATTKFTDGLVRISIDGLVNGLMDAATRLNTASSDAIKQISRVQGGP